MKKTYINPEIATIQLKINQHLLEGSPVIKSGQAGTGSFGSGANLGHSNDGDDW